VLIGVLQHMIDTAVNSHPADLALLGADPPRFGDVPRLKFREAQQLILERHGEDRAAELDLSPQDERWLGEWASQEYNSDFVFVTHYPTAKRAFIPCPTPPTRSTRSGLTCSLKARNW
jgi:nondiscriminating aspartyl-tRNA synthetase